MKIKVILEELGVRPSKGRGQNFLIRRESAQAIARFAGIEPGAPVVEVGPGLGVLTRELAERTNRLAVVEIEDRFCDYLLREVPALTPERVIRRDVRKVSGEELGMILEADRFYLISNVPYSISSELTLWTIANRKQVSAACFLLQKEFARRIAAGPGSKTYGSLSVLRALYADAELGPTIKGSAFHPPAQVDSSLLKLTMLVAPRLSLSDEALFEQVVRAAFGKRRKTLINSLLGSNLQIPKEQLSAALHTADIAPDRRAETLSLNEFARLTEAIHTSESS